MGDDSTVPLVAEPPRSVIPQQDGPAPETPPKRSARRAYLREEERQAQEEMEEAAAAAAAEKEDEVTEMAPSTPARAPSGQRT